MLTLIVPGLIWTRQALADLTCDLPLPAFTTLLGRGRLRRLPPTNSAHMLAGLAGLTPPLPAAALRRLALSPKREADDNCEWLCLDPVQLRFEQRRLILDEPQRLELDDAEAQALAVSLAPTFSAFGELHVIAPQAWNLRLDSASPAFQDLAQALGRSAPSLPLTPEYAPWRQAISEAQMLLHAHPVNQARQAAGRAVVNSLWPWGGGRLPALDHAAPPHDALRSNDPVALGIARLLQIDGAALPPAHTPGAARQPLVHIDALEYPARSGDALVWREHLAEFETRWLAPALAALRGGQLDALRLLAPGELASAELHINRLELWKFWRKTRALTELAPT